MSKRYLEGTPLEKVERHLMPIPESGCWVWLRDCGSDGYGCIRINKKLLRANRIMYEAYKGPIPEGLCVLHRCDVRQCCNPDHLFLGTRADNNRDMFQKKRHHYGERCSWSKLTEEQVRSIKASKDTQSVLSMRYSISQSMISQIKSGKRWKHATA